MGEFREAACKLFGIDPKDVRIWDYLGRKKQAVRGASAAAEGAVDRGRGRSCLPLVSSFPAQYLARDTQELREASIMNNQPMLLELRNEDGTFPELPKSRGAPPLARLAPLPPLARLAPLTGPALQ